MRRGTPCASRNGLARRRGLRTHCSGLRSLCRTRKMSMRGRSTNKKTDAAEFTRRGADRRRCAADYDSKDRGSSRRRMLKRLRRRARRMRRRRLRKRTVSERRRSGSGWRRNRRRHKPMRMRNARWNSSGRRRRRVPRRLQQAQAQVAAAEAEKARLREQLRRTIEPGAGDEGIGTRADREYVGRVV